MFIVPSLGNLNNLSEDSFTKSAGIKMLEMNISFIQRAKKVMSDFNFEGDVCSSTNCVTRAPLLYFIRSWVALSFKVCERVSESIRDPWHWVEPTGSSLRLCLLFVLCPVLKDDKQIYPIRMIQFKTWTCWKNHIMAIFGALCHLCKANFCSWRNNQDDLWTIHRKVGVRSFANSKKSV